MSAVAVLLRTTQLARARGVVVTFEPGWETRGNGYVLNPAGVLVHHTATPTSLANPFPTRKVLRDGRTNLAGPLCNTAGPADGSIHVMAAGAANHAGAAGGKSMGPLPVTSLFNPRVFGHEIDYAGVVPMLDGQYRAAVIWSACLLVALVEHGYIPRPDPERARAHAETSITGKFDIGWAPDRTYDMPRFRADVARVFSGGLTMTSPADVWNCPVSVANPVTGTVETWSAGNWVGRADYRAMYALRRLDQNVLPMLAQILDAVTEGGVDSEQLMARLEKAATEAAERGAREGVTADIRAALDEMEQRLNADDADQAKAGALSALGQLREVLPAA